MNGSASTAIDALRRTVQTSIWLANDHKPNEATVTLVAAGIAEKFPQIIDREEAARRAYAAVYASGHLAPDAHANARIWRCVMEALIAAGIADEKDRR